MIINNKTDATRFFNIAKKERLGIITDKPGETTVRQVGPQPIIVNVVPGLYGDYPEELKTLPKFERQVEVGNFEIIPTTAKDYKTDSARKKMDMKSVVKVPDFEVVKTVLAEKEAKAIQLINLICKEATLEQLMYEEKRGNVSIQLKKRLEYVKSYGQKKE